MSNKLVVVVGATGTQGGAVVAALLTHGGYTVRAVTRNTDTPAAQALTAKGVEVVSADIVDKDSLVKAFKAAYAVFGVSIPFTKDNETIQGKNIVDACKTNNVPLLVWSSLPSATEISHGKYTEIYQLDYKQAVDKYIASVQQPAIILHTGVFTDNLLIYQQFNLDPADPSKWILVYPIVRASSHISNTWVERDFGNMVTTVLDKWEEPTVLDKWEEPTWRERLTKEPIPAVSHRISGQEMVDSIKRISGKDVTYIQLPGLPDFQQRQIAAESVVQMFKYSDDGYFNYPGPNPPQIWADLGLTIHSFDDYVREKLVPFMQQKE